MRSRSRCPSCGRRDRHSPECSRFCEAGPGRHAVGVTFAARTRTVRVPVSVLDKGGQPVLGLRLENFRVADNGKPQTVSLFSGERSALRIALALDTSRSMLNKIRQVEAEETGGRAEVVSGLGHYTPDSETRNGGKLQAAVESIAMTLRHRYLVGYDPPDDRSGWRTIRVDVDRSGAVARTRKGYYSGS